MLISGTHGVEGFAGSALQVGLLDEGIQNELSPESAVLMIHAINPYGMAHLRRFNEDNVDLNRNFRDHAKTPPENCAYQKLAMDWGSSMRVRIDWLKSSVPGLVTINSVAGMDWPFRIRNLAIACLSMSTMTQHLAIRGATERHREVSR